MLNRNLRNSAAPGGRIAFEWRTPIGPMRGEAGPRGLHALWFPAPQDLRLHQEAMEPSASFVTIVRPGGAEASAAIEAVAEQTRQFLDDYFQGRDPGAGPALDLEGYSAFDQEVWRAAQLIGFGRTLTYGELAQSVGRPRAARAVGGALGRNELVIVVPCHRVLARATGVRQLGGFTGGLELKARLLEGERIHTELVA